MTYHSNIYFLRPVGSVGPVKIGCSLYPKRRKRAHELSCGVPLEIVASVYCHHNTENFLQRHFLSLHSHGEWYWVDKELQELMDFCSEHSSMPNWVDAPDEFSKYMDYLKKYPRGKPKGKGSSAIPITKDMLQKHIFSVLSNKLEADA